MVNQPAKDLHRQILEGERRPVKQLQHEGVGRELNERNDGRMAEAVIGLARHARDFAPLDRVAGKQREDFACDLGIGAAGEARDRRCIKPRPRVGNVEPAVARKTGKRHVDEAKRRGFASS